MQLKCMLALLLFAAPAAADPLLYRITDADSTVWLLGSVHALRAEDYPLDEPIESAYREAERVVLEVNPAELEPSNLLPVLMPLAQAGEGRTLADHFSKAEYADIRESLAGLGLDIEQFKPFEPWFVALQVFSLNLARHGFAAAEGVDTHYAQLAARQGKPVAGLETAREQLELFDNLPAKTQKAFLLDTLEESDQFREEMEKLVSLWRAGDVAALEAMIDEEFAADPALREAMLASRNRNWIKGIASYLDEPGETLVIVGALHLVGDDSVIELLREEGHEVERVASESDR